jgi:hypothetical protein
MRAFLLYVGGSVSVENTRAAKIRVISNSLLALLTLGVKMAKTSASIPPIMKAPRNTQLSATDGKMIKSQRQYVREWKRDAEASH